MDRLKQGNGMGLRQRRQFSVFGLPEMAALVLIGAAIVPVTLWSRDIMSPQYRSTQGHVMECNIHATHYNASDAAVKVTITYCYTVEGIEHINTWTGLWPETGSPNALPPDELARLETQEYPLTVFYDPSNPERGELHIRDRGFRRIYGGLSAVLCGLAVAYCGIVYPKWRNA